MTATAGRLNHSFVTVTQSVKGLRQDFSGLATKAELAEKPSKAYLVGLLAVLITAYAAGLAALAIIK